MSLWTFKEGEGLTFHVVFAMRKKVMTEKMFRSILKKVISRV